MHQRKMEAYREGIGKAFADTADTPLDFGKIAEQVQEATSGSTFKGQDISRSTAQVRSQLGELFRPLGEARPGRVPHG